MIRFDLYVNVCKLCCLTALKSGSQSKSSVLDLGGGGRISRSLVQRVEQFTRVFSSECHHLVCLLKIIASRLLPISGVSQVFLRYIMEFAPSATDTTKCSCTVFSHV